jgi:hypothetical protein
MSTDTVTDLGDLSLGADQPATGRMLIKQQRCYALCLFALDDEADSCDCSRCDGAYHGALSHLLDAPVVGAPRRSTAPVDVEPALFDVRLEEEGVVSMGD